MLVKKTVTGSIKSNTSSVISNIRSAASSNRSSKSSIARSAIKTVPAKAPIEARNPSTILFSSP